MIECTVTCQRCEAFIILSDVHGLWVACCPNCLDDDPTSEHEILQGKGSTPEDALQNWFDNREALGIEPEFRPTELSAFVVPKSPKGWRYWVEDGAIHYGPSRPQKAANDS